MKEQRVQDRWKARESRHLTDNEGTAEPATPREAAAAKIKANRSAFGEFLSQKRPKKH